MPVNAADKQPSPLARCTVFHHVGALGKLSCSSSERRVVLALREGGLFDALLAHIAARCYRGKVVIQEREQHAQLRLLQQEPQHLLGALEQASRRRRCRRGPGAARNRRLALLRRGAQTGGLGERGGGDGYARPPG
jgi:hypothetical protein